MLPGTESYSGRQAPSLQRCQETRGRHHEDAQDVKLLSQPRFRVARQQSRHQALSEPSELAIIELELDRSGVWGREHDLKTPVGTECNFQLC
jgi:hypothetical protein